MYRLSTISSSRPFSYLSHLSPMQTPPPLLHPPIHPSQFMQQHFAQRPFRGHDVFPLSLVLPTSLLWVAPVELASLLPPFIFEIWRPSSLPTRPMACQGCELGWVWPQRSMESRPVPRLPRDSLWLVFSDVAPVSAVVFFFFLLM